MSRRLAGIVRGNGGGGAFTILATIAKLDSPSNGRPPARSSWSRIPVEKTSDAGPRFLAPFACSGDM